MSFQSKLPKTKTSIFAIMSRLAKVENAINLSQGFPDFDCDPKLQSLVTKHMKAGHNQYAPMAGVPNLIETLGTKIEKMYKVKLDTPKQITVTSGATQGLYAAISALVRQGDEVIVIEPSYDSYVPAILMNGGIPKFVSLEPHNNFTIPWNKIREHLTDKTKLLIINSPHNPTGALITQKDIHELEQIVAHYDLFILSDEVYEHITFDGNRHISVLESNILRERSIVTFSFGKVLHTTGWKLGYAVASKELTTEFRKVHQFMVFSCNAPMQYAIAEYYKDEEYLALPSFFERKRNLLLSALKGSNFSIVPSQGTYFQLLGFSEISNESDVVFAERITREYKVASIPISAFYHNGRDDKIIRLCFAKSDSLISQAAEILKSI